MHANSERLKMLLVFVEDVDEWKGQPLYEAILRRLLKAGIAGATAWHGIGGYGAGGRLHHRGLLGVADEKPIIIAAIDTEEKLRTAIPNIVPMIKGGVVLLQDAEVFTAGGAPTP